MSPRRQSPSRSADDSARWPAPRQHDSRWRSPWPRGGAARPSAPVSACASPRAPGASCRAAGGMPQDLLVGPVLAPLSAWRWTSRSAADTDGRGRAGPAPGPPGRSTTGPAGRAGPRPRRWHRWQNTRGEWGGSRPKAAGAGGAVAGGGRLQMPDLEPARLPGQAAGEVVPRML
jgi:hypothetical protein